ncbi:hypothetical protein GGS23DRAFT_611316 [Durotheca rogersii]|uniref:uncharacterized protein n=1 Tax=Durotheca rogersii TaxID=419775 RepID=UPI00222017FE|nr:uncharacterized protein GGS23DRAFT_611316 [Durotheca rogersii]KAI5861710.1 hypothetical protein GGS23DRAFT_611316 [Durotheca rogersii]
MAGLVAYESSSDEEEVPPQQQSKSLKSTQDTTAGPTPAHTPLSPAITTKDKSTSPAKPSVPTASATPPKQQAEPRGAPMIGPQIGPISLAGAGSSFPPLEEAPMDDDDEEAGSVRGSGVLALPPGSPYSATRALVRDLTLPAVPNTDAPGEPGGAAAAAAATTAKMERFLALKRGGTHFNERVARMAAQRNPAQTDKLLAFAGAAAPAAQYRAALAPDLGLGRAPADPAAAFPPWAYYEPLRHARARARPRGAAVEFVASAEIAPAPDAGSSNPHQGSVSSQGSGVPRPAPGKRRTRFED